MLERLIDQLDLDEPIGILSHHLAMDEPCWTFFDACSQRCLTSSGRRLSLRRILPVRLRQPVGDQRICRMTAALLLSIKDLAVDFRVPPRV